MYATVQYVSSAKVLYPGQLELTDQAEVLAARREVERLSAYKFIQAISHQLSILSGGQFSIDSFVPTPPLSILLEPLSGGDQLTYNGGSNFTLTAGRFNFEPQELDIGSIDMEEQPMKILADQSKVGMAAAAFLSSTKCLVQFSYDKVHRLIRDLKLPMSFQLQQTVLQSTYIWGCNDKPFNKGNFFSEKVDLMEAFLNSETPVACPNLQCAIGNFDFFKSF